MSKLPLRILYFPYFLLVLMPIALFSNLFFGFLAFFLSFVLPQHVVNKISAVSWATVIRLATPVFTKIEGLENIEKNRSYVVVANHRSFYDIFVIYSKLPMDLRWVMKHTIRKIPGVGIGSERVGHVFLDRSSTEKAIASLEEAKNRISNGASAMFFPEGTRQLDTKMAPFKKGAFRFALDLNLPVLPISVIGTQEIMRKKSWLVLPGMTRIVIHPAIETDTYTNQNIQELIDLVQQSIQRGLDKYEK